jgi:DUF438 domain-containing protein
VNYGDDTELDLFVLKVEEQMEREKLLACILDSYPYPVVFADGDHIIRYLNKNAEYFYYQERGYNDLVGKSIFACHNDKSKEKIIAAVEKLKNHGMELFLGVDVKNRRIYIQPVRNENGELIGYIERFEMNVQK